MIEPAGHGSKPPERGPLQLLFDPVFGGMFWGQVLASTGVWIHSIVAAIVVYGVTGSALMVGLVSVVQFAPQLVLSPLSGTSADRGHALTQILVGRLVCVAGSASLTVWLWATPTGDSATTLVVLGSSLVAGLGFVVGGPAMQSIFPTLVRPPELTTALALLSAPSTVARVAGPVIGAGVAAQTGPAEAFALAAACHGVFAVVILVVTFPPSPPHPPGVDYSVRAALRYVRRDRPLLFLLVAISAVGFGSEPSLTLAPGLAQEVGGGTALVGQLSAVFGVGAAVGLVTISVIGASLRSTTSAYVGLWLMGAGLMGVTASPGVATTLVSFGVSGLGFAAAMTGVTTLIQQRTPDELRGRVMSLWMIGFIGARPIGAAAVGAVADVWSIHGSFVTTAVLIVVTAQVCRPRNLADPPHLADPTGRTEASQRAIRDRSATDGRE